MFVESSDGTQLHVEEYGLVDRPAILFNHSLATDKTIWGPVIDALSNSYRLICLDMRGHGKSETPTGPYTISAMAGDVVSVLDALGINRAHYVGLSMGGMIGLHLAVHHPNSFRTFTIASAISETNADRKQIWQNRIEIALRDGMGSQVEEIVRRWFAQSTIEENSAVVGDVAALIAKTPLDGYVGSCHAIAGLDLTNELSTVTRPCLILVGEDDQGTPPQVSEVIHRKISGSEFEIVSNASHQLFLERPKLTTQRLAAFLERN